jgi:localization factor PodJL
MTSVIPWSVKGVDPEAREAAKLAARKAGMTLGDWLNQTIRTAAAEQLKHGAPRPAGYQQQYQPQPTYNDMPQGGPYAGTAQPPAPTIRQIYDSIQRLSARVEAAEDRAAEQIAPLAEKVAELSTRVEEAKTAGPSSTAPLERAMTKISDRLQKIEDVTVRRPSRGGLFGLFGHK